MTKSLQTSDSLFQDLKSLIVEARQDVARQVNSALVLLYWRVGQRIRQDILKEERAEYGEEIVPTLSAQLGWSHFVALIPLDEDLNVPLELSCIFTNVPLSVPGARPSAKDRDTKPP